MTRRLERARAAGIDPMAERGEGRVHPQICPWHYAPDDEDPDICPDCGLEDEDCECCEQCDNTPCECCRFCGEPPTLCTGHEDDDDED